MTIEAVEADRDDSEKHDEGGVDVFESILIVVAVEIAVVVAVVLEAKVFLKEA